MFEEEKKTFKNRSMVPEASEEPEILLNGELEQ